MNIKNEILGVINYGDMTSEAIHEKLPEYSKHRIHQALYSLRKKGYIKTLKKEGKTKIYQSALKSLTLYFDSIKDFEAEMKQIILNGLLLVSSIKQKDKSMKLIKDELGELIK